MARITVPMKMQRTPPKKRKPLDPDSSRRELEERERHRAVLPRVIRELELNDRFRGVKAWRLRR